jgi:phage gp46-like protein
MTSFQQDLCATPPEVNWGTFWEGDYASSNNNTIWADWSIDAQGLSEANPLYSAVLMQIFTDKRAPDDRRLPDDTDDRRGWHGDYYDVLYDRGEDQLGSLLWLYERAAITEDTVKGIRDAVDECLEPLERQGLFASREVTAERLGLGYIAVDVRLYAQDREKVFDARFSRLWSSLAPGLEVGAG